MQMAIRRVDLVVPLSLPSELSMCSRARRFDSITRCSSSPMLCISVVQGWRGSWMAVRWLQCLYVRRPISTLDIFRRTEHCSYWRWTYFAVGQDFTCDTWNGDCFRLRMYCGSTCLRSLQAQSAERRWFKDDIPQSRYQRRWFRRRAGAAS